MESNFWTSKVKITDEEKLMLVNIVSEHYDQIGLFRIGMFLRRIEIDETLISSYKSNFQKIIDQVILIIETGIINYKTTNILTYQDLPIRDSNLYLKTLTICNESDKIYINHQIQTQRLIRDFLSSKSIHTNHRDYIDIDSMSFFSKSIRKIDKYNAYIKLNGKFSGDPEFNDVDLFYILIKEREEEFNKLEEDVMDIDNNVKDSYKIIVDEISYFIYRLNILLKKYNYCISMILDNSYNGNTLKFQLLVV